MKLASLNIISAVIVSLIVIYGPELGRSNDIGTNFFLKASKSIPRIGRRAMDYDKNFMKASKSVPRIGRRNFPGRNQDVKGIPVRNSGSEMYLNDFDEPSWNDWGKQYNPSLESLDKINTDYEGDNYYWTRVKKDSELEEPRIQPEVYQIR